MCKVKQTGENIRSYCLLSMKAICIICLLCYCNIIIAFILIPPSSIRTARTAFPTTSKTIQRPLLRVNNHPSQQFPSLFLLQAVGSSLEVKIIGIGSASPPTIVSNKDLETVVETSDEWIQTRTGISQRHLLINDEKVRDIATKAASNALQMAAATAIDPIDIDLVICASSTADDIYGDAASIASNLGCTNAFAFDLVAACSGFLFGLITASQFLNNNNGNSGSSGIKNALVIGADGNSRWVDWDDRNTCVLAGDGAGALVITTSKPKYEKSNTVDGPGILSYAVHSNGRSYNELNCMYTGTPRHLTTPNGGIDITSGSFGKTRMNGKEVYKFATREVPEVILEALRMADGMTVNDIDWLLLHQANIRIIETVALRLGIPMDKVIVNIDMYGNTSAASIPIALDEAVRSGKVKKGDVIACSGFGAGLSWGAVIMKWGGSNHV